VVSRVYIRGFDAPFLVCGSADDVIAKLREGDSEAEVLPFVSLELVRPTGEVLRLNPFAVDAVTESDAA
jgi:hypothetical protein